MPLESLSNEQINIHDLTLDQEKKPMAESLEHYKNLKDSAFYNQKNGQWSWMINENQSSVIGTLHADDQLLGVLVEAEFDKNKAKQLYEHLKQTNFYDAEDDVWNGHLSLEQEIRYRKDASRTHLIGILCEAQFDQEKAKKDYARLKQQSLYDEEHHQWIKDLSNDADSQTRLASTQLLGVLVETKINGSSIQNLYDSLKETRFYYDEFQAWKIVVKNQNSEQFEREVDVLLIDVLVQAQFDKEKALSCYLKLKKSSHYDESLHQWKEGGSGRLSSAQLLGILCEHEFEKPTTNLQSSTPELPETRKY